MVAKVALETKKTSTQQICNSLLSRNRGFTLIEVMIVLAIFGAMLAIGLPRLTRTDTNIRSVARHMTVLIKETRNHARMKNRMFRIVFELGGDKGTYWVESTAQAVMLNPDAPAERSKKDAPASAFQEDKSFLKEKAELPGKLKFVSIETEAGKELINEGRAYLHFFPEGLVEGAVIQIGDGKELVWSLVPNSLTGRTEIVQKAVRLKDLEGK